MEIKLKTLKAVFFVCVFTLGSLVTYGQGRESEKEWIASFKDLVFYNGLLKGLANKEAVDKLISIDNSFYNPVFRNLHYKAINRGGDYIAALVKKDYLDREGRVAEPASGRRPLLIALRFYESEKLHKMAKDEYVKWMKTPNKQELIDAASIAY